MTKVSMASNFSLRSLRVRRSQIFPLDFFGPIYVLWMLVTTSATTWAYPDFIGYGYGSCMNCHFNGAGGGPLNDYGRGLFAAEIAARPFYNLKATGDQLSESSGFFGRSNPLGDHIRPGAKVRSIYIQNNPGSRNSISRSILMQADLNMAVLLDPDQKAVIVGSLGYAPTPRNNDSSPEQTRNLVSREYYLRWQMNSNLWLYTGFLDKPYGIRTADHTSYSRVAPGVTQNDQSHGLIFHFARDNYEFFVNPFVGNLLQKQNIRQQGLSLLYEYQPKENIRYGTGGIFSKNDFVFQKRIEAHSRVGIGKGNSVLMEVGLLEDSVLSSGAKTQGAYGLAQGMMLIRRGFNLLSVGEYYKSELNSSAADQFRWHMGMLYFPMQRFEVRTEFINSKVISPDKVTDPGWSFQGQIHLSL